MAAPRSGASQAGDADPAFGWMVPRSSRRPSVRERRHPRLRPPPPRRPSPRPLPAPSRPPARRTPPPSTRRWNRWHREPAGGPFRRRPPRHGSSTRTRVRRWCEPAPRRRPPLPDRAHAPPATPPEPPRRACGPVAGSRERGSGSGSPREAGIRRAREPLRWGNCRRRTRGDCPRGRRTPGGRRSGFPRRRSAPRRPSPACPERRGAAWPRTAPGSGPAPSRWPCAGGAPRRHPGRTRGGTRPRRPATTGRCRCRTGSRRPASGPATGSRGRPTSRRALPPGRPRRGACGGSGRAGNAPRPGPAPRRRLRSRSPAARARPAGRAPAATRREATSAPPPIRDAPGSTTRGRSRPPGSRAAPRRSLRSDGGARRFRW